MRLNTEQRTQNTTSFKVEAVDTLYYSCQGGSGTHKEYRASFESVLTSRLWKNDNTKEEICPPGVMSDSGSQYSVQLQVVQ